MYIKLNKVIALKSPISALTCLIISVIIISGIGSCTHQHNELKNIVNDISNFECRAEHLKNQRFELADKIRFTQDSLPKVADTSILHNKLLKMDTEKQLLVTKSLQLADTIRQKMNVVMTQYFTDKQVEDSFNNMLNRALEKKGCK